MLQDRVRYGLRPLGGRQPWIPPWIRGQHPENLAWFLLRLGSNLLPMPSPSSSVFFFCLCFFKQYAYSFISCFVNYWRLTLSCAGTFLSPCFRFQFYECGIFSSLSEDPN